MTLHLPPACSLVCPSADRPRWLEARRAMLTASDVPAALGLSPWCSPLELWARKRGLLGEPDQTEAMEWGLRLEGAILAAYAERTGRDVVPVGALCRSERLPWLGATFDALTAQGSPVEVKTTSQRWDDDEPPEHILAQLHAQMLVADAHGGGIVALCGGRQMRWWDVERRAEWDERILRDGWAFWQHVLSGEPPPPDGSDSAAAALLALHPVEDASRTVELPPEADGWDTRLAEIVAAQKSLDSERSELRQRIEMAIAGAERGLLPGGGAWTWRTVRRKGYAVEAAERRELRREKPGRTADARAR